MQAKTLRIDDTGAEVATLQRRLNLRGAGLLIDHVFGKTTDAAVRAFQRGAGLVVDGVAGPRTQAALLGNAADSRALTQADIEAAAATLGCDVPAIQAVIAVESPKGGFLPDGRVVILFERHVFYKQLTAAGIDPAPVAAARPDICNPKPGGYLGGSAEYGRLAAAKQIDDACALASASWGRFQIMGYHAASLGYATVQDFVADMTTGEAAHLRAFCKFLHNSPATLAALQNHDWPAFAAAYNGPGYARNQYDARLFSAFTLHGGVQNPAPLMRGIEPPTPPEAEQVAAAVSATDAEQPATDVGGTSRRGKRKRAADTTGSVA